MRRGSRYAKRRASRPPFPARDERSASMMLRVVLEARDVAVRKERARALEKRQRTNVARRLYGQKTAERRGHTRVEQRDARVAGALFGEVELGEQVLARRRAVVDERGPA